MDGFKKEEEGGTKKCQCFAGTTRPPPLMPDAVSGPHTKKGQRRVASGSVWFRLALPDNWSGSLLCRSLHLPRAMPARVSTGERERACKRRVGKKYCKPVEIDKNVKPKCQSSDRRAHMHVPLRERGEYMYHIVKGPHDNSNCLCGFSCHQSEF